MNKPEYLKRFKHSKTAKLKLIIHLSRVFSTDGRGFNDNNLEHKKNVNLRDVLIQAIIKDSNSEILEFLKSLNLSFTFDTETNQYLIVHNEHNKQTKANKEDR